MKSELVIGAFKEAFPSESGVYSPTTIDYSKIYSHLVIAPRFTLENNSAVRHLINYDPITRWSEDKKDAEYLVYQRPDKGSGEKRLAGDFSIGFGGHVEYNPEVVKQDSVMLDKVRDIETGGAAIALAVYETSWRENNEELKVNGLNKRFTDVVIDRDNFCLIIDNSNDVGLHHVGICVMHQVHSDVELMCGDGESDNIKIVGWFTAKEIQQKFFDKLESWSKMLTTELNKREQSIVSV